MTITSERKDPRTTADLGCELAEPTPSSRLFNRRPVIPGAKSEPSDCGFRETRAYACLLTRSRRHQRTTASLWSRSEWQ